MKTKSGRTNEKNVSQILCRDARQSKPYPNVIRARHMNLSLNDNENLVQDATSTVTVDTPKKASDLRKRKIVTAFA